MSCKECERDLKNKIKQRILELKKAYTQSTIKIYQAGSLGGWELVYKSSDAKRWALGEILNEFEEIIK